MQFEENGERIDDLKLILDRVAFAATLFDDDGIEVRFMNAGPPENMTSGVKTAQQVQTLMTNVKFSGLTPLGSEMKRKVIDPIFLSNLRAQRLKKPVLVISVTDGQPTGDVPNNEAIIDTIKYAVNEASRSSYGAGAIAFQFAQVGNDLKAREFLGKLDNDPVVGSLVDCTSSKINFCMT